VVGVGVVGCVVFVLVEIGELKDVGVGVEGGAAKESCLVTI